MLKSAVWVSDDLKTCPVIWGEILIKQVQLRRPKSVNFTAVLGELGIEHSHQVFGRMILKLPKRGYYRVCAGFDEGVDEICYASFTDGPHASVAG